MERDILILMTPETKKHLAVFLVAISFILLQVIVEVAFFYVLAVSSQEITTFVVENKALFVFIHLLITLILIVISRPFARRFYRPNTL